jgi:5-methylcytosine-specific restriction enzyme subunit McrC
MQILRTFEYETLVIDEISLTSEHIDRLERWNARLPERKQNKYFSLGRNSITFKQYVGVLQIGNLTIEILPKIDQMQDEPSLQKVLLQMLQICQKIPVDSTQNALLATQSLTLLDVYIHIFWQEIHNLLHKGLIRKYQMQEGNLPYLKGKIKFTKHIAQNCAHQERFYTAHDEYSKDHLLHQILYKALQVAQEITQNPYLHDKLKRLAMDFPAVQEAHISSQIFQKIPHNRKTLAYQKALQIAKMLLLNDAPDVQGGRQDVLPILFDMNKLFEGYVARVLQENLYEKYEVITQTSAEFWKSQRISLDIRPDILLVSKTNPKEKIILDTKWKLPFEQEAGKAKPSSQDLYQMFAYCQHFQATQSYLVYPSLHTYNHQEGTFMTPYMQASCGLWFVQLLDNENLNRDIDLHL